MAVEKVLIFIGQIVLYGGGAAAISYGLFMYFGKKWLDNQFAKSLEKFRSKQDQELEHYRFEINSLFNRISKIHEKEFEILPEAWKKLVLASGHVMDTISPLQTYTDLTYKSESEIDQILDKYNLDQFSKNEIKGSLDINKAYQKMVGENKIVNANKSVGELHNYLIYYKIFLNKELYDDFDNADKLFTKVLGELEINKASKRGITSREYFLQREEIIALMEGISSRIQQRLHYNEAT